MPRQARVSVADVVYHVINRANGRAEIFHTDKDYQQFESLLQEAKDLTDMRILAYCIMPNHWHLVLYPHNNNVHATTVPLKIKQFQRLFRILNFHRIRLLRKQFN